MKKDTLPIELELRKLGLREKEVSVYLAGLELGPTSVQEIAKKAKFTRPTVYVAIKNLKEKGFFAEIKKEKKKYYLAQSPASILRVLKVKKREIEEKEREFIRIIAALESRYSKERQGIREYKGKKGLKALEEKLSFTASSEIFVLSSKTDLREMKKRERIYQKIKKRLGKVEIKEIYPQKIKAKRAAPPWLKRKFSPLPGIAGTLIILSDTVIFLSSQKQEGLLIENEVIANSLRVLSKTLWALI